VTARQLDGLIEIALDPSEPDDERMRAGKLAADEIQRIERASRREGRTSPSTPTAGTWFDAMTGDFNWLDRQRRFPDAF
jgi:hypothetical protein